MTAPPSTAIDTRRLILEPLLVDDADEMVDVLGDPRLHGFTGGRPATLDELRERYRQWTRGASPDGIETWLNWIVRQRPDRRAVGTVQATVSGRDAGRRAEIAWIIGIPWQGRGFATEAARALVEHLRREGVRTISASIHPDHHASEAVAAGAGLEETDEVVDGERVWRWRNPAVKATGAR